MDWLRENWFWTVVIAAFFWMHMKMHGGHGHGGHGHGGSKEHGSEPNDTQSNSHH
jgi:hypothetical protein